MSPFLFNFIFLKNKKIYKKENKIPKKYFPKNNFQQKK